MRSFNKLFYQSLAKTDSARELELKRLAEFGRVGASLIHDMAAPLTSASLTLEQMQLDYPNSLVIQMRRDLKQLERYVQAAHHQLRGKAQKTSFSLNIAVNQVVMIVSARAKRSNIDIVVNLNEPVRLYGDRVRFHQVLANLLINAIEAYEGVNTTAKVITITSRVVRQNKVTITITDNGQGIHAKDLSKIFETFYSTKRAANQNLGLGLATVKRIIESDFKGTIRVSSKLHQGTRFSLTIPLGERIRR